MKTKGVERERERERERDFYIGRGSITLLEDSQSSTARPSGGITIKMKTCDEGDGV